MYANKMKKNFISLITLISILIFSGCSNTNEENNNLTYETKISEFAKGEVEKINTKADKILSENNSDKKLSALKSFIEEANKYSKNNNKEKDVTTAYDNSKDKIISEFQKADRKKLADNKVSDVEKENREALTTKVNNLNSLKEWTAREANVVYSKNETNKIESEIDKLIKTYQDKLKKIDIAEKAAAEKAAAEKAAAEQAAAEKAAAEQAAAEKAAAEQAAAEKAAAEQAAAEKAVAEQAAAEKANESTGYTRDSRGRWHRPNGQYASKAEIAAAGLPW